jgi:hypothetical protein
LRSLQRLGLPVPSRNLQHHKRGALQEIPAKLTKPRGESALILDSIAPIFAQAAGLRRGALKRRRSGSQNLSCRSRAPTSGLLSNDRAMSEKHFLIRHFRAVPLSTENIATDSPCLQQFCADSA